MNRSDDYSEVNVGGGHEPHKPTRFQRLERHALSKTLSGLFVLIPLLITLWVLYFAFGLVDGIVRPIVKGTSLGILDFAGVGVIFALVIFYLIGLLVVSGAGNRVVSWQSFVLSRVPVVKSIYGVAKQITDTFSSPMGHRFSRVVFIEWPQPGIMALGFVTGHCHSTAQGKFLVVVYIPTAPNPTSGNLAFVSEEDILGTDISVEDAMKIVFSGGIVLPTTVQVSPGTTSK